VQIELYKQSEAFPRNEPCLMCEIVSLPEESVIKA
jgi:hypothetical protein